MDAADLPRKPSAHDGFFTPSEARAIWQWAWEGKTAPDQLRRIGRIDLHVWRGIDWDVAAWEWVECPRLPDRPGVYLVRARAGAEMVSAGLVHNISAEAAAGRVNAPLLGKVASLTGGAVLGPADSLPPAGTGRSRYMELSPFLLRLLLVMFLVDLAIRRWENVLGMAEWSREAAGALVRRRGRD